MHKQPLYLAGRGRGRGRGAGGRGQPGQRSPQCEDVPRSPPGGSARRQASVGTVPGPGRGAAAYLPRNEGDNGENNQKYTN